MNLNIEFLRSGYIKLRADVDHDISKKSRSFEECEEKFNWAIERAKHYAEKTDMDVNDILDAWESKRDYWYFNYYQEANQPAFKEGKIIHVFENAASARIAFVKKEFRCPACGGVSTDPNTCNSGEKLKGGDSNGICNWKAWGFFRTMGEGVTIFLKDSMDVFEIFKPIAWEKAEETLVGGRKA